MSDKAPIRGVLFDLDGTLYNQALLRSLMAVELLTLPLSGPMRAVKRLRALGAYRKAQEELRAETSIAGAQISVAAERTGLPEREVEGLVNEWMMTRPLKYLRFCRASGVDEVLGFIERTGLRMGVLSDYPAESKLKALGLADRFSTVLCATDPEIDAFKPSPRGFLRACELWKLSPAEVLFVGDRPDVDAVGATAAGMRCVIVNGSKGSFERLRRVLDDCC